jgi:hypothetical protein
MKHPLLYDLQEKTWYAYLLVYQLSVLNAQN